MTSLDMADEILLDLAALWVLSVPMQLLTPNDL